MLIRIQFSDTLDTIAQSIRASRNDLESQEILRLMILSYFSDELAHLDNHIDQKLLSRIRVLGIEDHMLDSICTALENETRQYLPHPPIFTIHQSCIKRTTKDTYTLRLPRINR